MSSQLIDILQFSTEYFEKNKVDSPRLSAELIISHLLGLDRLSLYLNYEKPLDNDERDKIKAALKRRAKDRVPIQYIIGEEEFYGYKFKVREGVLIPRPETELLVEKCIEKLKKTDNPKILDIGLGSGAISITLAKEIKDSLVLGVDLSEKAIEIATENKENIEVKNLKILQSDMFTNVKYNEFDLIVSNPPYIHKEDYDNLMPEVKNYEPEMALIADENGLYFYRNISEQAGSYLKSGGYLAFELGYDQSRIVKQMMQKNGFKNIEIYEDYGKIERIIIGEKA